MNGGDRPGGGSKFDETADVESIRESAREAWLVISSAAGVRAIPLPRQPRVVIGRMHTCDIVIEDESVSRQHAALLNAGNGLTIEDLGSRNKTKVMGRSLGRGETAPLSVGSVVEIGYATMFVQMGRPATARVGTPSSPPAGGSPHVAASSAIILDPTMQRLYALLDVIAPSPLNVLVLGETGIGKEVFAEAVHNGSLRARAPLLRINCAALSGLMRAQLSSAHARLARLAVASTLLLALGCSAAPRLAHTTSARAPKTTAPLPAKSADLASWIDAYAGGFGREWGPAFAPAGYLMVTKDGVPIVARSYGKANPKSGATIGPSTQLQLGSVTKQFTAVAILQLAEKKRVNLTDSVRAHVAGLPHEFDAVTLHHLLTQTSGIANYTADPELMAQRDPHLPRERVVASFAKKPLAFVPGQKFDYSNSNYFLLGMVIEKVSGKTYEEYLQANVLGPANMLRSTTAFDPHTFDAALGTTVDASEKVRVVDVWDTPLPFAAGALRSTAIDMVAWDRALTSGKLLNADSERRRTTPEKDDYAYGVAVEMKSGYLVESHGGRIEGFRSFFARVPAIGVAVVFLSNSDDFDASAFGGAVTRMIVEGKPRPPKVERAVGVLDAELAARLAGTYELLPASREKLAPKLPPAVLESVAKMTVTIEGSHIVVKASGQPAFVAFPGVGESDKSAPSFFTKTSGIVLVPAVGTASAPTSAGDQVSGFRIEQAGLVIEYVRATPGT